MVKVGTDHQRSSNPASLLKQGLLKHVTQDFVQMAFISMSPGEEIPQSFWSACSVLSNIPSKEVLPQSYKLIVSCVKKCFLKTIF